MNNWLFYGTARQSHHELSAFTGSSLAGAACGTAGVLPRCSGSSTRFGLAAGGGVEYAINPQWSMRGRIYLERLRGRRWNESINLIRAGVNYRFGS